MAHFSLQEINQSADLLGLCPHGLRKVASSQGGEWSGPCPLCGGTDRFHVQPYHHPAPHWLCRKCSQGSWRSPLDLVMVLHGLSLPDAARWLASVKTSLQPGLPPKPGNRLPCKAWKARSRPCGLAAREKRR